MDRPPTRRELDADARRYAEAIRRILKGLPPPVHRPKPKPTPRPKLYRPDAPDVPEVGQ